MKPRSIAFLSLLSLVCTLLWLAALIYSRATSPPPGDLLQLIQRLDAPSRLYDFSYANAALITLLVTLLFASLYPLAQHYSPGWAAVGLVFVPVYAAFNLFVYLSQITLVPRLVNMYSVSANPDLPLVLLEQLLQSWPASTAATFNNLAYALLGIPSIIYGIALLKTPSGSLKTAGGLLALNGFACLLGFLGILWGSAFLANGSLLGGVLFLLALFPLTWGMFSPPPGLVT